MSETTKRIIFGAVSLVAVLVLVWGSYLPYRKSKLYVAAISASSQATTLEAFLAPYLAALNAPSPLPQDELARNFATTVGSVSDSIVQAKNDENLPLVSALAIFLDRYTSPVIYRQSGVSAVQTMLFTSNAYRSIFQATQDRVYLARSRKLLERALELSPDRPQLLYALFDYERFFGSPEDARIYGEKIMRFWPSDTRIPEILDTLGS